MMQRSESGTQRSPMQVTDAHFVNGNPLRGPFPEHLEQAIFGMGCFWSPEKLFWETDGVYTTAAGFAGGHVAHPAYREVCGGNTGHAEVVLVVYDPQTVSYSDLLDIFWDGHTPSRGLRERNESTSQYRSVIFAINPAQEDLAKASRTAYEEQLQLAGDTGVATQIEPAPPFYYAEERHQQYLAKTAGGSRHVGTSR